MVHRPKEAHVRTPVDALGTDEGGEQFVQPAQLVRKRARQVGGTMECVVHTAPLCPVWLEHFKHQGCDTGWQLASRARRGGGGSPVRPSVSEPRRGAVLTKKAKSLPTLRQSWARPILRSASGSARMRSIVHVIADEPDTVWGVRASVRP